MNSLSEKKYHTSESLMTGRRYAWSEIKDLSEFYVITYLNKCHVFDE